MQIMNISNNTVLAYSAKIADTFISRLKGLLGTASLPARQCLVIKPCSSVHTFGMKYSLDIVFMDKNNRVLRIVSNLPPNRIACCSGGSYVLEFAGGSLEAAEITVGDYLQIDKVF